MSGPQAAIVTTVRNPGPSIRSFASYHLRLGFRRIYMFFDDPADEWMALVPSDPRVCILRSNDGLRERWPKDHRVFPFVDFDVQARQTLNADLAVGMALNDGIEWLLHLDADEAFHLSGQPLAEHLYELQQQGIDHVTYLNWEVVVTSAQTTDFFRDLTWFKINPFSVDDDLATTALRQDGSAPLNNDRFFFYYTNGKSCARVHADLRADGPHKFFYNNDSHVVVDTPCILHYMNAGLGNFVRRYRTWGAFPDTWFDGVNIARLLGPFHLEARDLVRMKPESSIADFYRTRIVGTEDRVRALADLGIVKRVNEVTSLLCDGDA